MTIYKIKVPQKYKSAYSRLIELVPVPFRYELAVQHMILENLKSKGEKYVIQKIRRACDEYAQKYVDDRSEQKQH